MDGQPLAAALPGQFVVLSLRLPHEQQSAVRSYSLSGAPGGVDYRISVKREPYGIASAFIHTGLAAGVLVEMSAPRGAFILDDGANPVLLVSAGIGATPMLAMLHALVQQHSTREVWWLYGARNGPEHPFAVEAARLLALLPNSHVQVGYSAELPTDEAGRDYTFAGRLSADVLAGLALPRDATAYICGPAAFMDEVRSTLTRLGVDGALVHTEIFGAAPSLTPGIAARPVRSPHLPAGGPGPARKLSSPGAV